MFKVWNVYKVAKGRRKGELCYPGTDEFVAKTGWCEKNATAPWDSMMGYFAFHNEKDAEAFRAVFGESKPEGV
jgi:hypothetical protein